MAARKSKEGKTLVIVESPAKAKTINKYLGDDFVVKASMGHVRDLPESELGIDVANGFRPTYEIVGSRTKVVNELRKLAETAPEVVLATDRDREGEAIAWHLVEALRLPVDRTRRVIFNEITKSAIKEAFQHPHQIDLDRVNAQQARRVLDRIVGYELSPLLWKKIARGLSAGRVQSVAVRLIVDREREIRAFIPEESWKVVAYFTADPRDAAKLENEWHAFATNDRSQKETGAWLSDRAAFRAELAELNGQPFRAADAAAAQKLVEKLGFNVVRHDIKPFDEFKHLKLQHTELVGRLDRGRAPTLVVSELSTKRTTSRPSAPFTTASLQQAASSALRYSASRTMRVAQSLYEGLDLHGEGPVGLITYMRTDSTNLAAEAIDSVRKLIQGSYGADYLPPEPNLYGKRQARAQEAHEAVRPTDPNRTPESLKTSLTDEQFKLYDLIWRRFVACQMKPAEWDSTSVRIDAKSGADVGRFNASGRKLVFDGFMRVAGVTSEDQILPALKEQAPVGLLDLEPRQQFTSPPARYTEASLIKSLEAEGIGRPSTYAAIVGTIEERGYVEQIDRKFFTTALGELVTDKLVNHFPKIMDVKFTSFMEDELDKIEDAHLDWVHVLREFYDPFRESLDRAEGEMETVRGQASPFPCPLCNSETVYRWSRTGRFLACSQYPKCKGKLEVDREGNPLAAAASALNCELCSKPMVMRRSRTGTFLGCSGYPECRNTLPCDEKGNALNVVPEESVTAPCEACGQGTMVVKWKGMRSFLGCNRYPNCKNTGPIPDGVAIKRKPAPPPEEAGVNCEKCGRAMVIRASRRGPFLSCSGYPKCRNAKPLDKLDELKAGAAARGEVAVPVEARGPKGEITAAARKVMAEGPPPEGFAMTRTGRPVVEVMPGEDGLNCPQCGNTMNLKRGRFGPFYSCSNFPRCKFNCNLRGEAKKKAEELFPAPKRAEPQKTDIPCEECGSPMLIREGRRGKFLGCSNYPKCKATGELPVNADRLVNTS